MMEKKKNRNEIVALSLIGTFSFAVVIVAFFFAGILIKKWCSLKNTTACTAEAKCDSKSKLNSDNNDEKYLISYQYEANRPDILNKGKWVEYTRKWWYEWLITKFVFVMLAVTEKYGSQYQGDQNEKSQQFPFHSPTESKTMKGILHEAVSNDNQKSTIPSLFDSSKVHLPISNRLSTNWKAAWRMRGKGRYFKLCHRFEFRNNASFLTLCTKVSFYLGFQYWLFKPSLEGSGEGTFTSSLKPHLCQIEFNHTIRKWK